MNDYYEDVEQGEAKGGMSVHPVVFIVLAALLGYFFFGCSDSPTGLPYNQAYGLKYDKLFDQPVGPPSRPPLPCGWYALNDSTWGYDLHADTCQ